MARAHLFFPLLIATIGSVPALAAGPTAIEAPPSNVQAQPQVQPAPQGQVTPMVQAPQIIERRQPQMDKHKPPPPPPTFQFIVFDVFTGGDDLRTDSSARANLQYQDGTSQSCMLKNFSDDTWNNNTEHGDISCQLNTPRSFDDLKRAHIQIQMLDCLWEGSGGCGEFESPDNWDIQRLRITLRNPTDLNNACLYDVSEPDGSYFARLTQTTNWVEVDGHATTC